MGSTGKMRKFAGSLVVTDPQRIRIKNMKCENWDSVSQSLIKKTYVKLSASKSLIILKGKAVLTWKPSKTRLLKVF